MLWIRGLQSLHSPARRRGGRRDSVYGTDRLQCGETLFPQRRDCFARHQSGDRPGDASVPETAFPTWRCAGRRAARAFPLTRSRLPSEIFGDLPIGTGVVSQYPEEAQLRDQWIVRQRPARNPIAPHQPYAFLVEEERSLSGEVVAG